MTQQTVFWCSDGERISGDMLITYNSNSAGDPVWWTGNTYPDSPWYVDPNQPPMGDNYPWYVPYDDNVTWPKIDPSPYAPTPSPNPNPPQPNVTISFPPPDDEEGHTIRAPRPSTDQILVEIAKVLKDGGSIIDIRNIFERHKLRLVDHDGEVIFDPKRDVDLEDKEL